MLNIPRLIRPTAFGLFLSGCATKPTQAPTPVPVRPAVPDFGESSPAYKAYQLILGLDVRPEQLDRGCHVLDYSRANPQFNNPWSHQKLHHAGDGRVQACEVVEYAMDRWVTDPELAEAVLDGPIPWSLHYDKAIFAKAKAALSALRQDPALQKLAPESPAYREHLAVGLYYFALFPDDPKLLTKHKAALREASHELPDRGLKSFHEWLMKHGGFGLYGFSGDGESELSAVETIHQKQGWCTEYSKVLFPLFHMAGLEPVFVYSSSRDLEETLYKVQKTFFDDDLKASGHIYVGIEQDDGFTFFDTANRMWGMSYQHYYPLRLIHYLGMEYNNRAGSPVDAGDVEQSLDLLERAGWFDPASPAIPYNVGMRMIETNDLEQAAVKFREAAEKDPRYAMAHNNLGAVLMMKKDFEGGRAAVKKAISIDPLLIKARLNLTMSWFEVGEFDEALSSAEQAKEVLDHITSEFNVDMSEQSGIVAMQTGAILGKLNRLAEAEIALREAIRLGAVEFQAYHSLLSLLVLQGRLNEADDLIEEMAVIFPTDPRVPEFNRQLMRVREAGGKLSN